MSNNWHPRTKLQGKVNNWKRLIFCPRANARIVATDEEIFNIELYNTIESYVKG